MYLGQRGSRYPFVTKLTRYSIDEIYKKLSAKISIDLITLSFESPAIEMTRYCKPAFLYSSKSFPICSMLPVRYALSPEAVIGLSIILIVVLSEIPIAEESFLSISQIRFNLFVLFSN